MSWSPLLPQRNARQITAGKPAVAASVSAGGGRRRPELTILLRPGMLEGITWLVAGRGAQVFAGHGEHAGMLRIMPDGLHMIGRVALAKPAGSAVALKLPLPAWLPPGARRAQALEYEFQDGWIEVTVPSAWWEQAPAATSSAQAEPAGQNNSVTQTVPVGHEPRGVALARQAAAEARRRAGL